VFKFIFRLIRWAFIASLGAAVAAKFMLESRAEPETQEIDLVSIFEGSELKSSADPFYGGKILTMFGGSQLDLRDAKPAPTGIYLDLAIVCGGLELVIPEGWRIEFSGNVIAGGFDDATTTDSNPDAVRVHIGGFVLAGGVHATNRSMIERSSE
jgi:hypothetical protein